MAKLGSRYGGTARILVILAVLILIAVEVEHDHVVGPHFVVFDPAGLDGEDPFAPVRGGVKLH